VALDRMRADGLNGDQIKRTGAYRGFGIRDGHGFVFVSNTGDICPAGFLPLVVGNVRQNRLAEVYRNAPVFQSLHDPRRFQGRCGYCEYHALCGGCAPALLKPPETRWPRIRSAPTSRRRRRSAYS
jgi:radical SAM protein with 4Fe4S-binding SPASM domain